VTTTIRASSLPSFADCPRRFAANMLLKEINEIGYGLQRDMLKSVGASIGTATHGGAAYIMTEKMKSGELGNKTESDQRALEDFTTAMQEGVLWDDTTPNTNDATKQVLRMVHAFRTYLAPDIIPVAVERRLIADIGDGFVLSGQSDMQVIEPDWIRDLKTGRMQRTHYAQLGAYSLLARTVHPEQIVKGVCVDFIPRASMKKPQPEPIIEQYNQVVAEQSAASTLSQIKANVYEFRRRIEVGDAPPEHAFLANPGSMLCNPKFCSAHGTNWCREHKKVIIKPQPKEIL